MTSSGRFIVDRLTDVKRETVLRIGKLFARHREAIPFLRDHPGERYHVVELLQRGKNPIRSQELPAGSAEANGGFPPLLNANAH